MQVLEDTMEREEYSHTMKVTCDVTYEDRVSGEI